MRILYFGQTGADSNAQCRAEALRRLGHDVRMLDPAHALGMHQRSRLVYALHYRTGYRWVQAEFLKWLPQLLRESPRFDLIWINGGELFGVLALRLLRTAGVPILLFNNDDPTGLRDGRRFDTLKQALPHYDLCVFRFRQHVSPAEYHAFGVKKLLRVGFSYDEVDKQPFRDTNEIPEAFLSEVAFTGTWIPGEHRDAFVAGLLDRGIAVSIRGNGWQKAPRWRQIRHAWRGPAVIGREYAAAIQGAKVSLGLLSKGNRDGHTSRSVEVPYVRGLLCAERTPEHQTMYSEGNEAVFWSGLDECADACRRLLSDLALRDRIREAGNRRVLALNLGNEEVCAQILDTLAGNELVQRTNVFAQMTAVATCAT